MSASPGWGSGGVRALLRGRAIVQKKPNTRNVAQTCLSEKSKGPRSLSISARSINRQITRRTNRRRGSECDERIRFGRHKTILLERFPVCQRDAELVQVGVGQLKWLMRN